MITVDPELIITDVNQQMVRLTETMKEELIGSRFNAYFTEPQRAAAGVQQTLRESFVTNYELTLRTPSGREILVSFNASVFKDTEGNIRGIFAVARDVTEQRRLEEQISEQQNYSRSLIEASVDALVTVNPKGRITDVNEQFVKLMGQNRQQLIDSPFSSYFTDPERAMSGVRQTFEEGIVTNYELVVHSKAARKIPVSFNAAVFRDTTGEVVGILAAARDITEQKQIEEELRDQQNYTRSLIESNIDALMTTDPLGVITDVNLQMCEITGHSREDLVGTPFKNYFTDPKRAENGIRKVVTEGRVTNYELTIKASSGRETVVSYNATTFRGTDGRLRGVFAAARDIIEQKTLEEQLQRKNEELEVQYRRVQEANRLKSEFLANMSHELRTPLNGIIGFTEMMYDGEAGETSDIQHEYLADILSSSRHLLQLINDVLDLAKVEAGKMVFYPEKVNLEQLVNEVRDILRLLINNKRIRFEVEIDTLLNGVVIDPAKFKQILYNYLSNALKFTSDEGQVTVRLRPEGEDAFLLEVEDTGQGIVPEDIGRLFVEFQQLDAGMAKKHQGTGLGLALTRRIVEAQGGRVGVRSVPGQGSTFFASLPRVNKTLGEVVEQKSEVDWRSPLVQPQEGAPIILVIEDDPKDRDWLVRSFGEAGYYVEVAATAAEALKRCQERAFDVITLDLLLPDASGWDVLRRIRRGGLNHDVPIIVVTMVAEKNVAMGLPIQDILSKPVQVEELLASLERARSEIAITDGDEQRSHHAHLS
jgi:PAS domain S-box-containing protein